MKAAEVILLNQDHDRVTVLRVPVGKVTHAAIVRWEGRWFVYQNLNGLDCLYYVEVDPPVDLTVEARL